MAVVATRQNRPRSRIVNIGGRRIVSEGLQTSRWADFYHTSMSVSWPVFFAASAAVFVTLNAFYAFLYWLGTDPVANVRPGHVIDLFYFSIETLATVGYGDMHPQTDYGHLVATVEIFTGMTFMAVMTGLVFSRFARPRAMILFSDVLAVAPRDGQATLMLRLANARHNLLTNASAKLWLTRQEITAEGEHIRRFHQLRLERNENPLFQLSWTLFHVLDDSSLLHGVTAADLERVVASFVVTINGLDEISSDQVHARKSYSYEDVRFGERYADILQLEEGGVAHIDFGKFHATVPIESRR